ncbi:MAG: hypothetical protein R3F41_05265 [Gammaproteobacteria bacterium]|nr:hypothetical protein [Pseudomonadales bacterium]MCP5345287.1 hypothetical protein [Pseudomonadales bacterium]
MIYTCLIPKIPLLFSALCCVQLFAQPGDKLPRIAHAGGQVEGATYTNSLEALNKNFAAGFRAFEIDFSWTSDRQLVCLHDWQESFQRSFDLPPGPPLSLGEFEQLVTDHSQFTKCTLASFMDWFANHPDTLLITDFKEGNLDALSLLSADYPQFRQRVIPQIYQPVEYQPVRDLGFERVIWTLYEYPGGTRAVLEVAPAMELWAVTMNTDRAQQQLPRELNAIGLRTYVHTVNEYADLLYLQSLEVGEIYTDSLSTVRERELQATTTLTAADSPLLKARQERSRESERQIEDFFQLSDVLYSLSANLDPAEFTTNQLTIQALPAGTLELIASGKDPYFNFPPLEDPDQDINILIDLDVPDNSVLEVFYTTRSKPGFAAEQRVSRPVEAGNNRLAIGLNEDSPVTRLRLDPGTIPGVYTIRQFEVRTKSRPWFRFLRWD